MGTSMVLIPTEECIRLLSTDRYDIRIRQSLDYNARQLLGVKSVNGEIDEKVLRDVVDKYALPLQRKLDEFESTFWDSEKEKWKNPKRKPFKRIFRVERAFHKLICECTQHNGNKREAQADIPFAQREQLVELVQVISKNQLQQPISQTVDTLDILQRTIMTAFYIISAEPIFYTSHDCVGFANIFYQMGLNTITIGERADTLKTYLEYSGVPDYAGTTCIGNLPSSMDWVDSLERFIR